MVQIKWKTGRQGISKNAEVDGGMSKAGVAKGGDILGAGLSLMAEAENSRSRAFNYALDARSTRANIKSVIVAGKDKVKSALVRGAMIKGEQVTGFSTSGFSVGSGTSKKRLDKTSVDIARTVGVIKLSTTDKVNNLTFQAEMADINSDLHKKISKRQRKAGIAKAVIGIALVGVSSYGDKGKGG